ncbi:MAG: ATP-binding cassette domain-containing protein [Candidatus Actinomarina sp.]|nr:ATP-binding cassette domain-containing protein [Candidatus Actinomarina sp.]
MTDIKVSNLQHIYPNGVVAVESVNVEIKQGEQVSVVGQNGSGKTTLVKHWNGLLKPTKGSVQIGDLITSDHPVNVLARKVGYVFQNPNHQIFAASVKDELEFGLRNIGNSEEQIKDKIEYISEEFGLTEYLETNPYRLGFSLRKTVGMASIIAMEPDVVVLDEPTTGQDYLGIKAIRSSIKNLKEQGKTVIVVSHDMPLVAEETDRVLVMCDTNLIFDGSPSKLFADESILKQTNLLPPQITSFMNKINKSQNGESILSVNDALEAL